MNGDWDFDPGSQDRPARVASASIPKFGRDIESGYNKPPPEVTPTVDRGGSDSVAFVPSSINLGEYWREDAAVLGPDNEEPMDDFDEESDVSW